MPDQPELYLGFQDSGVKRLSGFPMETIVRTSVPNDYLVPEPTALALLAVGSLALAWKRRRTA